VHANSPVLAYFLKSPPAPGPDGNSFIFSMPTSPSNPHPTSLPWLVVGHDAYSNALKPNELEGKLVDDPGRIAEITCDFHEFQGGEYLYVDAKSFWDVVRRGHPVRFVRCYFEEGLDVSHVRFGEALVFESCVFRKLVDATETQFSLGLTCRWCVFLTSFTLAGAEVHGGLDVEGCTIYWPKDYQADQFPPLTVPPHEPPPRERSAVWRGLMVHGQLKAMRIKVFGSLDMGDVEVRGTLSMRGAQIGLDLPAPAKAYQGRLYLRQARIDGDLELSVWAESFWPDGQQSSAQRTRIHGDLSVGASTIHGRFNLRGARIDGCLHAITLRLHGRLLADCWVHVDDAQRAHDANLEASLIFPTVLGRSITPQGVVQDSRSAVFCDAYLRDTVRMRGVWARGALDFENAELGGSLELEAWQGLKAYPARKVRPSIIGRTERKRSLILRNTKIDATVNLDAAILRGQVQAPNLRLTGAFLCRPMLEDAVAKGKTNRGKSDKNLLRAVRRPVVGMDEDQTSIFMHGARIGSNLEVSGCYLRGGVHLRYAKVGGAVIARPDCFNQWPTIFGCARKDEGSLYLYAATVGGNVCCDHAYFEGEVSLELAKVHGSLQLTNARLNRGPHWTDLQPSIKDELAGARVVGDQTQVESGKEMAALRLARSQIDSDVDLNQAKLIGDLMAFGVKIRGDLLMTPRDPLEPQADERSVVIWGDVRLSGAEIDGAWDASQMEVTGTVYANGTRVGADVRLCSVQVLSHETRGGSFVMEDSVIGGSMCLQRYRPEEGVVNQKIGERTRFNKRLDLSRTEVKRDVLFGFTTVGTLRRETPPIYPEYKPSELIPNAAERLPQANPVQPDRTAGKETRQLESDNGDPEQAALDLHRLTVNGSLRPSGKESITGAADPMLIVYGDLRADGITVSNRVILDFLACEGDLRLSDATIGGELRLQSVDVAGTLSLSNSRINGVTNIRCNKPWAPPMPSLVAIHEKYDLWKRAAMDWLEADEQLQNEARRKRIKRPKRKRVPECFVHYLKDRQIVVEGAQMSALKVKIGNGIPDIRKEDDLSPTSGPELTTSDQLSDFSHSFFGSPLRINLAGARIGDLEVDGQLDPHSVPHLQLSKVRFEDLNVVQLRQCHDQGSPKLSWYPRHHRRSTQKHHERGMMEKLGWCVRGLWSSHARMIREAVRSDGPLGDPRDRDPKRLQTLRSYRLWDLFAFWAAVLVGVILALLHFFPAAIDFIRAALERSIGKEESWNSVVANFGRQQSNLAFTLGYAALTVLLVRPALNFLRLHLSPRLFKLWHSVAGVLFRGDYSTTRGKYPLVGYPLLVAQTEQFDQSTYMALENWLDNNGQRELADEVHHGMRNWEINLDGGYVPLTSWTWKWFYFVLAGSGTKVGRLFLIHGLIFLCSWLVFSNPASVEHPPTYVLPVKAVNEFEAHKPDGKGHKFQQSTFPFWAEDNGHPQGVPWAQPQQAVPSSTKDKKRKDAWGWRDGFWVALNVQIPLIHLWARDEWEPSSDDAEIGLPGLTTSIPPGMEFETFACVVQLFSYLTIPMIIASISRRYKRRET
jgi:hypothetical protein